MSQLTMLALASLCSIPPLAQAPERPFQDSLPHAELAAPAGVRWHASYDAALAAARVSGKPVMLFQLLGQLDDALC
jgi:hypothetical protein